MFWVVCSCAYPSVTRSLFLADLIACFTCSQFNARAGSIRRACIHAGRKCDRKWHSWLDAAWPRLWARHSLCPSTAVAVESGMHRPHFRLTCVPDNNNREECQFKFHKSEPRALRHRGQLSTILLACWYTRLRCCRAAGHSWAWKLHRTDKKTHSRLQGPMSTGCQSLAKGAD
jgi:hypothetical protein